MREDSEFLQPGRLLENRYRILQLLGQGGMGRVFLAEDERLPGKKWAVKELKPGPAQQELLAKEARVLAECSHPGLAAVTDFIPANAQGVCYLVMEFIQGQTLLQVLREQGPLSWAKAASIGIELCQVLAYLHEGRPVPIIHRDLKPSNVMLDENGRVRLIDFGTARHYNQGADADTVRLGTLGFASPEQLLGRQTDARTDLYALGAVLHFLLEGGTRHPGGERGALPGEVPPEGQAVISKLLEEEPSRRFQRASEVETELRALAAQGMSIAGRRTTPMTESKSAAPLPPPRMRIVVGGLTSGSGATFTAIALARCLHALKLPHTLLELPGTAPDLYHILMGDQHTPKGYRYWTELVCFGSEGGDARAAKDWVTGCTEWAPLAPNRTLEKWDSACAGLLLDRISRQVVIMDLGSSWTSPAHEAILAEADLILLVCDPSPLHLSRSEAARNWGLLGRLKQKNRRIEIIANKAVSFKGRQEWLESLPDRPFCQIPEIPSQAVLSALWQGRLLADQPEVHPVLQAALEPVISLILAACSHPGKRTSIWQRLRPAGKRT
ncbi:MAG: serine/threonine protein kinase [Paenibacillaceae bacterium]|nr:serine/threonine protein kinase [Paenibacillaceae bacterium]